MAVALGHEVVERIWARDPTLWTGSNEDRWLGWLDEPVRMPSQIAGLERFADEMRSEFSTFVVLGMGGSSLAAEVLKRSFDSDTLHVLDTTHPAAIRRAVETLDLAHTLFVAASKTGTTLETRVLTDFFWEQTGRNRRQFVAITDPDSPLEHEAQSRGFREVFHGEPTVGGRYSALSPFGLLPGALIGMDVGALLKRGAEMYKACGEVHGNPGLELGVALGAGWAEGRDKAVFPDPYGFGLWAEQLIAESTGKQGKGLVPAPGEVPEGLDRQAPDIRLEEPYDLGAEFFRWEFAVAVAGSILGVNPFDQPDVEAAKEKTYEALTRPDLPLARDGSAEALFQRARPGDYVAIQAFIDPARRAELEPLVERARRMTGCIVTKGLGPRYLHSTGQLHKGGPNIVLCLQVVDEQGEEVAIPGWPFGFARLFRAQACGDLEALKERGRRVARIHLDDVG